MGIDGSTTAIVYTDQSIGNLHQNRYKGWLKDCLMLSKCLSIYGNREAVKTSSDKKEIEQDATKIDARY